MALCALFAHVKSACWRHVYFYLDNILVAMFSTIIVSDELMTASIPCINDLFWCCSALLKLLDHIPQFLPEIARLPASLKHKIFFLMLKRGLVTDQNIGQVLHSSVHCLCETCWSSDKRQKIEFDGRL